MLVTTDLMWWQRALIYQLVVPSFLDSNGDGFGDLDGVIARLDYLEWLGVSALWLSPIYPTPFRDLGYDVTDFTNVDARFGTLETFDALVAQAHERGIAIILDWVPNHTSSEHPWFIEACASRESEKRDWYIWRDPRPDGAPPNNWISIFGGSVWEWHEPTGRHYLHTFHRTQPDLNWRNEAVQAAMLDALRFWLDRGVDGFRIDACCLLFKDEELRDNPPNPGFKEGDGPDSQLLSEHTRDQPGLHEVLARIRELADSYSGDRVLLGELYLPLEKVVGFYGSAERPELHLPLHMGLTWTDWNADALASTIADYHGAVNARGWPANVLSTHDVARLCVRAGAHHTRIAAMLLLTSRGAVTLYYGEEIGMEGVDIPPDRARDPQGRRTGRNRDPARTPMQWNGDRYAGFSSVEPWLPVGADRERNNVAAAQADSRSLLSLYRRLIALRNDEPVLVHGSYERIACDPPLFAYRRAGEEAAFLILLNFASEAVDAELGSGVEGHIVLSTALDRENETCSGTVAVRGDEGLVIRVDRA